MKEIDGKYINRIKTEEILPLINNRLEYFKTNYIQNKSDFIKSVNQDLIVILEKHSLPPDTFRDLSGHYWKMINDKFIFNK